MSVTGASATVGRRICAALAACSAVFHGLMVGDAGNAPLAVLIVAMALACLYCAHELWAAGSPRVWCIVATTISVVEAGIATAVLWFQTPSRASSLSLAARNRGAI